MKQYPTLMLTLTVTAIVMWLGQNRLISNTGVPQPPTPMTKAVRLFSLSYGEAANEIGVNIPEKEIEGEVVSGPSCFAVAQDGTFYFADAVNNKIKRFDRTGQLLHQITVTLPRIDDLAVASDGYVYVIYNGLTIQLEVFDSQGKSQPQIAKQMTKAVRAVSPGITLTALRCDTQGNLYGQAFLNKEEVTIRITRSGQVTILPAGVVDPFGRIWGLKRLEERKSSVKVYKADGQLLTSYNDPAFVVKQYTVYDPFGRPIRHFNLPSTALSPIERSVSEAIEHLVDGRGHIFLICPSLTMQWKNVIRDLKVLQWHIVMEYDDQGNRIGVRAILNEPNFHNGEIEQFWDIDQIGNVYYLDFKAEHLEVMMAPAIQ